MKKLGLSLLKLTKLMIMLTILGGFQSNAQDLITNDFNDGELFPFRIAKADQEARVYIVNGAVETHWDEDLYNGSNSGRKAQFMPQEGSDIYRNEFWMGFDIKIGSDYMKDNTNTDAGLMQIWGWNDAVGSANHYAMIKFDGRNGGGLVWNHRFQHGTPNNHLIQGNFPREEFVSVIVNIKLSSNGGDVRVWLDDVLKIDLSGQNIGWGDMDANGQINQSYSTGASLGQYNFRSGDSCDGAYDSSNHCFDGHLEGETRTVTYDNVSMYFDGSDGYDIVNPDKDSDNGGTTGGDFTPDPNKTYYIDVPHHNLRLGATGEGEDPFTTSTNATGADVEWKFVSNGDGDWHIDLADGGSTPRLRTDNSAFADMQATTSDGRWESFEFTQSSISGRYFITSPNGPSQYNRLQVNNSGAVKMVTTASNGTWESFTFTEVVPTTRIVHITKRNASGFALDASNNEENGQNVYLWNADPNNENQLWEEIDRGDGYYSYQKYGTNYSLDGNRSGANNQSIYLWTTSDTNQNQQWQKVAMGDGGYKLIKRNASGYAINGGNRGANGQDVNLYDSSNSSQNLQWYITPVGSSAKSLDTTIASNAATVSLYPNPVVNTATIQGAVNSTINIYGMNGSVIFTKAISSESETIDLSALTTGIYYAKIESQTDISVVKIVKQ